MYGGQEQSDIHGAVGCFEKHGEGAGGMMGDGKARAWGGWRESGDLLGG